MHYKILQSNHKANMSLATLKSYENVIVVYLYLFYY